MTLRRRDFMAYAAGSTLALPVFSQAPAAWPAKPITLVVPFPAGGTVDWIGRAIANEMQSRLKSTVIVDNKPGATGTIGFAAVARAPADGYTLVIGPPGAFAVVPHLFKKKLAFDPAKDFDLLTVAVQIANVLVVPANAPFDSVAALIAHGKAHPGKLTFANSGSGASDHLAAALFLERTGVQGLHVPYKGGAPAINDLLGGQVDASFQNINAVLPYITSGKLKALGQTGRVRSPVLPQTPTMAEAGVQDMEVQSWQGLAAPRGLPPAVRRQLLDVLQQSLRAPAMADKLAALGMEVVASTPEAFATRRQAESDRWQQVIQRAGITMD